VDDEYNARICDFGVSVTSHQTGLATQPGSRGTAAYKAPETIDWGEDDAATYLPTCASDVYATTVHIWEVRACRLRYERSLIKFVALRWPQAVPVNG
jgi:serine/threonine protein kinase